MMIISHHDSYYDSIRVREMSIALMAAKQFSSAPTWSVIEKHKVVFKVSLGTLLGDVLNMMKKDN